MDPQRTYDYLCLARGKLFDAVRPLSADQYLSEWPIGPGSLAAVLAHMLISEWYYIERLEERDVPPYEQWEIRDENPPAFTVLEAKWTQQAGETRASLERVGDWDRLIEYRAVSPDQPPTLVSATARDIFTQLVLHEVHHRAQALNMLRQLGAPIKEDLDFNALMYNRRQG